MNETELERFLKRGYAAAYDNRDAKLMQRSARGLNCQEFKDYCTKLQEQYPHDELYKTFKDISKQIHSKDKTYLHSEYQMTVSAVMAQQTKCVGRIASGMGKTFVVIALTRHFVSKGESVLIVLANDLLYDQFHLFSDLYLSDLEGVQIKLISALKASECQNKVVICDEFDDMIDRFPVLLLNNIVSNQIEKGGMLALIQAKRLYLLSATVNSFYSTFCHKVLKIRQ